MNSVAAIAIGRNEGQRLQRCLMSLRPHVSRLVYVDSGSTDDSVAFARSIGAQVVELDPAIPFSAARGRNEGFNALSNDLPQYVQFVDGDCEVDPSWIPAGMAALAADQGLGVVTGWRTERYPEANAYHAMAEIEWHQPAGEIVACGGDMMLRSEVFAKVGGFDPAIVAAEDEDFVIRVRQAGYRALRLPLTMTLHDIAISKFREWWRRNIRSGQGFAEVGDLRPPHFKAERIRAIIFGFVLPVILIIGLGTATWWLWIPPLIAYSLSTFKVWRWLLDIGTPPSLAPSVAGLFTLAKLPHFIGLVRFYLRGGRKARAQIIEYK